VITLYDNPFSPFARKVRLVLAYKGQPFESIDALAREHHEALLRLNPRGEVPVLDDGGFIVIDSSDICAYLEDRYPKCPVYPRGPRQRARVRAWERTADSLIDAIVHDISIWGWPTHQRTDTPPDGLIEKGRSALRKIAAQMEEALGERDFLCGELTVADFAVFPHVSSFRALGVTIDAATFPQLVRWIRRMRSLPQIEDDLAYVKQMAEERFASGAASPYEGKKIIWRGDRLEWLFASGFHEWWVAEREAGRAVVPSSV